MNLTKLSTRHRPSAAVSLALTFTADALADSPLDTPAAGAAADRD